jgi:hypothetical protein
VLGLLACTTRGEAGDEGSETTAFEGGGSSSESNASSSESNGSTETETETGEDEPADACPATPVLDSLHAIFDGLEIGYDYPYEADWVENCTVSAHAGDLLTGESITLECVTAEGEAVEHVLELQASLVDAEQPTQIPVEIGESLQLTLWSRVWHAGGASWVLRDAEQLDDIRLIYYSTIDLFEPHDFSPLPAFVAPLQVGLRDDLCEIFCPDPEETGGFVPPGECDCEREQALEFMLGSDSVLVQNGSAGAIGSSMFAFVRTAKAFPNPGGCSDHSGSWYTFITVAR